jgi:23S rRNA (uridine2552-2'-O)-methyltransferase
MDCIKKNGVKKIINSFAKYLMGGTEHLFSKRLQSVFAKVKHEKPDSSRKQSTERFFVAMGYRPLKKPLLQENKTCAESVDTAEQVKADS